MSELDRVRVESNERLDIPDFEELVRSVPKTMRTFLRKMMSADNRVVSGFTIDASTPTVLRVTRASGQFLGKEDDGVATSESGGQDGALAPDDASAATTNTFEMTGLPAGVTYNVYVRARFDPYQQANRAFWDPGTDTECIGSCG